MVAHRPPATVKTFTIFSHRFTAMISDLYFRYQRKSRMSLQDVYFWTDTIKDWKHLLKQDKYKSLIINTLKEFSDAGIIKVYGFVIMPNHIHLIWELVAMNGKELPNASFNKKTAHSMLEDLEIKHPAVLPHFLVNSQERKYRFWQRDPLAILMDSKEKLEQKLEYIHCNPLQEKWNLAKTPQEYFWSSSKFYETGHDDFGFLTHYMDRF
jgi:putative transposase